MNLMRHYVLHLGIRSLIIEYYLVIGTWLLVVMCIAGSLTGCQADKQHKKLIALANQRKQIKGRPTSANAAEDRRELHKIEGAHV